MDDFSFELPPPGDPTPPSGPADVNVVRAALRDQLDCYQKLQALSAEQSRHVFAGDTDALLDVLARREAITAAAGDLEVSLAPVKADFETATARWLDSDRSEVAAIFGQVRDLLEALTKQDEKDAAALRAQSARTGAELRRLDAGDRSVRRINQRYAAAAYGKSPSKVDREL